MTTNQTIGGVPREFVREGRYIVVKPDYEDDIRTERLRNYIEEMCFHTPDCVVVEADWPEYEPVWRMIEARVIGNPTELDAANATISKLQGLVAELRSLLDAERCTSCDDSGDLTDLTGEWRGYCVCPIGVALKNKPAAQPQGEPVALLSKGFTTLETSDGKYRIITQYKNRDDAWSDYTALCKAEQPAPVAVVLPERREPKHYWDRFGKMTAIASVAAEEWNACLDELKRLYPSL